MAKVIEELLRPIIRSFIEDRTESLLLKLGHWGDTKIASRTVKIILGFLLGILAFFSIPVLTGLLGF
jgi:hypothetical protein